MSKEKQIDNILNSGTTIIVGAALFFIFSVFLYSTFPEGYWIAAALFILFGSKHLYGFISRRDSDVLGLISSVAMKRIIAFLAPLLFAVLTWFIIDGL